MLVQKITLGALMRLCWYRRTMVRLCWYSRVLQEHSGGSAGTAQYYRSTWESVLVHSGGDAGTAEYYIISGVAVLVQ